MCLEQCRRFVSGEECSENVWLECSALTQNAISLQALLVAEHSELGGEIHLLEGKYRSLLIEGWDVDVSIIGHGHAGEKGKLHSKIIDWLVSSVQCSH